MKSKIISAICAFAMTLSVTAFAADKTPSVEVTLDSTETIAEIKLNGVGDLIYSAQLTLSIGGKSMEFEIEPTLPNAQGTVTQKNGTVTLYVDSMDLIDGSEDISLANLKSNKTMSIGSKADLILINSSMTTSNYNNIKVAVNSTTKPVSRPQISGGGSGITGGNRNTGGSGNVVVSGDSDNSNQPPQSADRFNDIGSHWAKADIEYVTALGLFEGTSNDTFEPNTPMTRAMYVTVLSRFGDKVGEKWSVPCDNPMSFSDTAEGTWYHDAVAWAGGIGLVNGMGDNMFGPNLAITREQLAVITVNFAKICGVTLPSNAEPIAFTDEYKINAWAAEAVKTAQAAGLMKGRDDGTFAPQDTATRAEVSAILHRFVEAFK